MFLSVVIPTIGRGIELIQMLKSVEPFLDSGVEVIVVDQNPKGFLDKSIPPTLLEKISVHHTDKKGVSIARNLGLSLASGYYVNFCDDDAVIEPNFIEIIKSSFLLHPSASMVSLRVFEMARDFPCMLPFPEKDAPIDKYNFHSVTLEFSQVWIADHLRELGGYDPNLGVGSRYGAEEGKDLVIRAIAAQKAMFYMAKTAFRHPAKKEAPVHRYFSYAEGTGALAVKHWKKFFVVRHVVEFLMKSVAGVCVYNLWKINESRRYTMRFLGFFSGFVKRLRDFRNG